MAKTLQKSFSIFFAAIAVLLVATSQAAGCRIHVGRNVEDIKFADVVFQGEVVNFERTGCPINPSLKCYGLIQVKVLETMKGEKRREWELYWWNSTFGVPSEWKGERARIFAGRWVESNIPPLRGPSATVSASARPDLLQVLQAPCSDPFILPATQEMKNRITQLLSENSVETKENDQSH